MPTPTNHENPEKGRGPGVTAITAILNLNEQPFDFVHLKYPEYNRAIPPGLFRYPWGTTAPVNWGAYPHELIRFGSLGFMWQHNEGPWHVRFKAGEIPANDADGEIVYSRRPSMPGEHYLILGVKGNRVSTLRSYTPEEALWNNLQEAVLAAANILKPTDYHLLATHSGSVKTFLNNFKEADEAGYLKGLDRRDVEALAAVSYADFDNQLNKLSEGERKELEKGKADTKTIGIIKKVLEGIGIVIVGVASAIAALLSVIAVFKLLFGPPGWLLSALLLKLVAFFVAHAFLLASFIAFLVWLLGFFEDPKSTLLLEEAAL